MKEPQRALDEGGTSHLPSAGRPPGLGLAVAADAEQDEPPASVIRDEKTGLPLIVCKHAASPGEEMTPERVADLLLAQEVEWRHGAG